MITEINCCQVLIGINESQRWKSFTQKFQIFTLRDMVLNYINVTSPGSGVTGSGVRHGAQRPKPVVPPRSSAESAEAYLPTHKASEGYPLRIHPGP
jgi:hypothetical protein